MEMPKSLPALMDRVTNEVEAYELLEDLRWAGSPVCPHCGAGNPMFLNPMNGVSRKTRTGSVSVRRVWKCRSCRKQFSVLTGTIFHGTKISIRTWLFVIFEMCASKNGVAAREIERKYDMTPKSAWYMLHRIREAMKRDPLAGLLTGTVVADETWVGGKVGNQHVSKRGGRAAKLDNKTPVVSLVSPATGEVRSFVVRNVDAGVLNDVLGNNVHPSATIHTDENNSYREVGKGFSRHESVNHSKNEYVREGVSTNMAEGFFSQLKRSIDGTHHHVKSRHLHRYVAEHDFRYSTRKTNDARRAELVISQAGGRRLSYKPLREGF